MEAVDSLLHHAQRQFHTLKAHTPSISHRARWLLASVVLLGVLSQLFLLFEVDTSSTISSLTDKIPFTVSFKNEYNSVVDYEEEDKLTPGLDELLEMPLYERLLTVFPYDKTAKSTPLDKNIIQTHKNKDYTNKEMDKWKLNKEDGFNYTMYDDKMAYRLLLQEFGREFPEIIEIYNAFPRVILRVDFFRYASLFLRGGTYSDGDTDPIKPLKEWITYNETVLEGENTVGAVIGIESECDCQDWQNLYSSRVQMCQWTLQARKHHPMYAMIIANIAELMMKSYNTASKVLTYRGKDYDFSKGNEGYYQGIMHLTGPGMFSNTVFQYVNTIANVTSINPNDQDERFKHLRNPNPDLMYNSNREAEWSQFGWENVTGINEPVLVDNDLLILPEHYFNGKKERDEVCLVQHLFQGSWKSAQNGVVDT